jgi:hypothetical protein
VKFTRGKLFHAPDVRELQRMIRTEGEGAQAVSIESAGTGVMVTLTNGERWLVNAVGYWLVAPEEVLPAPAPPPMPGASSPKRAPR